jgi:Zn-dependent protease
VDFAETWLLARLTLLIPLLLSLAVHEWAHAWVAWQLGDDTAARQGRLTLDPLAHVDPLGTFLLPLLGVPFGWAKPVPVNPIRFHRSVRLGTGLALTAAAGPLANLVLAAFAALASGLLARFAPEAHAAGGALPNLLQTLVFLNLIFAVFNLLPIPPLDGSRILDAFLPARLRPAWDALSSAAPAVLVAVLLLPVLLGISLFAWPLAAVETWLDAIARLAAG